MAQTGVLKQNNKHLIAYHKLVKRQKGKIMGNIKRLEFTCVNRIKYEKREKFEESLFADVYGRAARLAALIINENIRIADEEPIDGDFCTEERFNNNISFWGERGMGKSSAMLSFALFLKNYDHDKKDDRFHLMTEKKPAFYVLPRIDAAMLVKGEYLLDIILAQMWTTFNEKKQEGLLRDSKANETQRYFEDVKNSYESYRKMISGEGKQEMTSVRHLKELSKCLNLKEDFKKLVDSFLECMLKQTGDIGFLVLAIDDLDVVVDNVNNILEQVRLFLSVPKVIVLVTADYGRLFLDCTKSFSERLIFKENIDNVETRQIRGYSEKYLAKIFPGNMRVHMPRINVAGGVDYNVKIPDGSRLLNGVEETFDEKKLLFVMLAKYTKIMMYPFDVHKHFLQKTSLRAIVNELYELEKMSNMTEVERFEAACLWMQTALIEEGKTIMGSREYSFAQSVMEGNSINETIIEILTMNDRNIRFLNNQKKELVGYDKETRLLGEEELTGYGQMLRLLIRLIESTGRSCEGFARFVLIFYSVQVAKLMRNSSRSKDFPSLYVKDVFFPSVEAAVRKRGDRTESGKLDNLPSYNLLMSFPILSEDSANGIQQFFRTNHDQIYNVFKLANLCEWNLWDENSKEDAYIQFEAKEETIEKTGSIPRQFSIGDFLDPDEEKQNEQQLEDREKTENVSSQMSSEALSDADAEKQNDQQSEIIEETEDSSSQISSEVSSDADTEKLNDQKPEEGMGEKGIILRGPEDHSKVSLEILLWNSLFYEEHLKGFCRNIYKALCTLRRINIDENQMKQEIEEIIANPDFCVEEYRKWRKSVKNIDDLLPWQSAEVMLHLAEEIGSVQQLVGEKDLLERILIVQRRQMDRVIQEMERIETYYQPLFAEKKDFKEADPSSGLQPDKTDRRIRYSQILSSYLSIVKPYNIEKQQINQQKEKAISSSTAM